jgi:hypothetical protein
MWIAAEYVKIISIAWMSLIKNKVVQISNSNEFQK